MEKTIEKAHELQEVIDERFKAMTQLKLSDAIRLGSQNSTQAQGWGDGETQCALHAGVQAAIALGFIEV
jgi:hypothetical protein